MRRVMAGFGLVCLLSLPAGGLAAADARTLRVAGFHLGPASTFKRTGHIPAGTQLTVSACLKSFLWCKVTWGKKEGWVEGRHLEDLRRGFAGHALPHFGKRLGIPAVVPRLIGGGGRQAQGRNERQILEERLQKGRQESLDLLKSRQRRDLDAREALQQRQRAQRKAREEEMRQSRERLRTLQDQLEEERRRQ